MIDRNILVPIEYDEIFRMMKGAFLVECLQLRRKDLQQKVSAG